MSEQQEHWRDILNKEWSKDFSTLKNKEIQEMIIMAFYQLFLIEVDSIKVISEISSNGQFVKFEIEGEAFRDSVGMEEHELNEED